MSPPVAAPMQFIHHAMNYPPARAPSRASLGEVALDVRPHARDEVVDGCLGQRRQLQHVPRDEQTGDLRRGEPRPQLGIRASSARRSATSSRERKPARSGVVSLLPIAVRSSTTPRLRTSAAPTSRGRSGRCARRARREDPREIRDVDIGPHRRADGLGEEVGLRAEVVVHEAESTPARAAMPRIVAPSYPCSPNSSTAAAMMRSRASDSPPRGRPRRRGVGTAYSGMRSA